MDDCTGNDFGQECSIDDFGSYTNISYLQTPDLALFALMDLLCDGDDNEGFLRTLLAQHLGLRQSTGLGDVLLLLLIGLENTLVTRKLVLVTFIVPKTVNATFCAAVGERFSE